MIRDALILALACSAAAFASYNYDAYGPFAQQNGTISSGGYFPYAISLAPGSSTIYTGTIPGNPNDYEVETVGFGVAGPSTTGPVIHFLRANNQYVTLGSGSYIGVSFSYIVSGGVNTGIQVSVTQSISGSITTLGSTIAAIPVNPVWQGAGGYFPLRSVIWGTNLRVFINNVDVLDMTVPLTTGYPGYGAGSSQIYLVSTPVGHHDAIAPATVPTIGSDILPTSVSLVWPTVPDDTNGIGTFRYQVSRNATFLGYALTPQFGDMNVVAGTAYTYQIASEDQHGNVSTPLTVNVTTPPAQSVDPRRVGLRTTGSYWGGGGEQIDTLSGNMNFSIPIATAMQRTGAKYQLSLVYNSQNWSQVAGYNFQKSEDVGFGLGWKLQFGSITPYYDGAWGGVDHYVFTDGTGAEYRLDINNSGIWSTKDSLYVWFDANAGVLHFPDGSYWTMNCVSSGLEADLGTMYPMAISDTSGNSITIAYDRALGLPPLANNTNTSGRITQVTAVAGGASFTYSSGYLQTAYGQTITLTPTYTTSSLSPPFGSDTRYSGLTTKLLTGLGVAPSAGSYSMTYDSASSGELQQVTFPTGGYISWGYQNFQYTGTRTLREVSSRAIMSDLLNGSPVWNYTISRNDSANPSPTVHANLTIADSSGVGAKTWNFFTPSTTSSASQVGLLSSFQQLSAAGGTLLTQDSFAWSQDPANRPYISSKTSVTDASGMSPLSQLTTQTLDQYGNTLTIAQYPWGNTVTPLRSYTNTYLSTSTYTSKYIFNLLTSSVLNLGGGVTKTLATNSYDQTSGAWSGYYNYSYTFPPAGPYGRLTTTTTPAGTTQISYYDVGTPYRMTKPDGTWTTYSADAATSYAAPMTISTQSYSTAVTYSPWLSVTGTTGVNGEHLAMVYDGSGRPYYGTSAYGGTTTYTYSTGTTLPQWQQKVGADGTTITTLDGFGRAVRVQRGDSSGMKSVVDSVYAPCACSPLGKLEKVSAPYPAGGSPSAWTIYTYDALGRTVSVVQPDGASTTTYSYSSNQTTTTDPAGAWKTMVKDEQGNLTSVVEPDPASTSGGTMTTYYSYDWMNHVSCVDMDRGGTLVSAYTYTTNGVPCISVYQAGTGTRQTRTFVYTDAGLLTSTSNPENGLVSYYYNTLNLLQRKHDAKGQDTVYTYDTSNRVTMIQKYPLGQANPEDQCQQVTYTYGTDPTDYSYGRLVTAHYGTQTALTTNCSGYSSPVRVPDYTEYISYNQQGGVYVKSVGSSIFDTNDYSAPNVQYAYDSYGRNTRVQYLLNGLDNFPLIFTTGYDTMGRPNSLVESSQYSPYTLTWVQNVQYDFAGRLSSMQMAGTTETRGYNVNGQLTSLNWSTSGYPQLTGGLTYGYSATQNNGQITQMTDTLSGETVVYQYDALKRLTSASSTPTTGSSATAWNETFSYDGFGNLTTKTLNGTAQSLAVNGATNQLSSATYDLNGNMTSGVGATLAYNVDNRLTSAIETSGGAQYYMYAPDGKRVFQQMSNGDLQFTFYGAMGERLGVYKVPNGYYGSGYYVGGYYPVVAPLTMNVLFAGRLIWQGNPPNLGNLLNPVGVVLADRVGTNRAIGARFYPYGDEITSPATSNDREKFATYTRDSYTGLDYADQRYYANSYGRFNTADPYQASGGPSSPASWNRYSYTRGDPVNSYDPAGLDDCNPGLIALSVRAHAISGCDDGGGGGGYSGSPCMSNIGEAFGEWDPSCSAPVYTISDGGGTGSTDSTPTCEQNLTGAISGFLGAKGSPLAAYASQIVQVGQKDDIDPTLIAAIAIAENGTARNNPFSLGPNGSYTYPNLGAAISAVGSTLDKFIYTYKESSVSALWSGNGWKTVPGKPWITTQPPAYCYGSTLKGVEGCRNTGNTISGFMKSMGAAAAVGGDPNNLGFPCPE